MKKFLLLLLFSLSLYAQTLTEKWNTYLNRYEYFNSNNQLVGYKQYNQYTKAWEYYDEKVQPVYKPQSNINIELTQQVLAQRQANSDYGVNAVQNTINTISQTIAQLSIPTVRDRVNEKLNEYIRQINSKKYDFSIPANVKSVIDWLYKNVQNAVEFEGSKYQKEHEAEQQVINKALSEIAYNSGVYTTQSVTEEKYNPYTDKYEVVSKDTTLTKTIIKLNVVSYLRQYIGAWKTIKCEYLYSDDKVHVLLDVDKVTRIVIDRKFNYIIFYEGLVGQRYTQRYIYENIIKSKE